MYFYTHILVNTELLYCRVNDIHGSSSLIKKKNTALPHAREASGCLRNSIITMDLTPSMYSEPGLVKARESGFESR